MTSATPLPRGQGAAHPLLRHFVCARCRLPLTADRDVLLCGTCGVRHPIVRGVPRFVPDDAYVGSFSFEWNTHKRTQLDSERGDAMSMDTLVQKTGLDRAQLEGKLVLDGGTGTGRFAEVMTRLGARVIGVDLSLAVEAAQENLGGRDDVLFAQADIGKLPFAPETFDAIVSIGVLHHTPDTRKHFEALVPLLKRGGTICIWVYPHEGHYLHRNHWIPFTNKIPSRMFYEWCRWLVPLMHRRKGSRLQGLVSRLFEYSQQSYGLDNDVLDTFDGYSPRYHGTHTPDEVAGWFRDAGLVDVREPEGAVHTSMRGRKP
ncbi:MAG: methyltransferase domain-containing protein [Planctomycetota bacterium]